MSTILRSSEPYPKAVMNAIAKAGETRINQAADAAEARTEVGLATRRFASNRLTQAQPNASGLHLRPHR